ncbi:GGDEF domain-containing protein [cf. Phormidesmis sp. LEGE 11477]|uniref:GGDEF domain-containing protein n=1 Tax=cf. Phormidesmis sp. LEGE 11477 TaxID=1828680 RepID=UPI0018822AFB|nr:GGDEF domain-containing protein [cf. Phormidesmis sp. LEGE 11477]MBE9059794.1 GGDEF domain-containing protein [cf. Phormidesmis sp. LEGE 11477]
MNNVLLFGEKEFITGVRSQVQELNELTITTAVTTAEAIASARHSPPDIIIAHILKLVDHSIFKTFGPNQNAYSIVIERAQSDGSRHCQQERYSQLEKIRLEKTARALETGADAYIWLASESAACENEMCESEMAIAAGVSSTHHSLATKIKAQTPQTRQRSAWHLQLDHSRLIQAYIQSGLHRNQRYRNLSRTNDWLSAVALNDSLTQMSNRRAFDIALPDQIQIARAKEQHLTLMVVDIDRFKQVNDRYGHLVGDEVLRSMTRRLSGNMRSYDSAFRYGGEEFVILLNGTDIGEGSEIADRIRQSIADNPFRVNTSHDSHQLITIALTVSIGVAALNPEDDGRGQSLLHRADQNLLKAKASGRNRVISEVGM